MTEYMQGYLAGSIVTGVFCLVAQWVGAWAYRKWRRDRDRRILIEIFGEEMAGGEAGRDEWGLIDK